MKFIELIFDLLKAYAWPIFFVFTLIFFKRQLINIGAFLGDIIKKRGIGVQHKDTSLRIDPPGTQEKDFSATAIPGLREEITRMADGEAEFGWLKTEGDSVEVTNELIVTRDPDKRTIENKTYEIGQQLHFAVVNGTTENLIYPICSIEFTSQFKHLHTENPAAGMRTINSDLWGMSGRLTELRDITISRTEISSVLARVLSPGQFVKFFVRFELPNYEADYNLRMKLKSGEAPERTKDLILKVKA
jgi:hypothetical protein